MKEIFIVYRIKIYDGENNIPTDVYLISSVDEVVVSIGVVNWL